MTVYFAHSEAYDPGQLYVGTKALGTWKSTGRVSVMMTLNSSRVWLHSRLILGQVNSDIII